jgi:hypothetical protein
MCSFFWLLRVTSPVTSPPEGPNLSAAGAVPSDRRDPSRACPESAYLPRTRPAPFPPRPADPTPGVACPVPAPPPSWCSHRPGRRPSVHPRSPNRPPLPDDSSPPPPRISLYPLSHPWPDVKRPSPPVTRSPLPRSPLPGPPPPAAGSSTPPSPIPRSSPPPLFFEIAPPIAPGRGPTVPYIPSFLPSRFGPFASFVPDSPHSPRSTEFSTPSS